MVLIKQLTQTRHYIPYGCRSLQPSNDPLGVELSFHRVAPHSLAHQKTCVSTIGCFKADSQL